MQENRWAVAVAYNTSRNKGLHTPDNLLGVRYSCSRSNGKTIMMMHSDPIEESPLGTDASTAKFAEQVAIWKKSGSGSQHKAQHPERYPANGDCHDDLGCGYRE